MRNEDTTLPTDAADADVAATPPVTSEDGSRAEEHERAGDGPAPDGDAAADAAASGTGADAGPQVPGAGGDAGAGDRGTRADDAGASHAGTRTDAGAAAPDDASQPGGPATVGAAAQEHDTTTAGQPATDPDPLTEAQRQRDEYLDHLRRERAEFENFRRRAARERTEAQDRGAELLVGNLLGVLDNFGFVLEAAKTSEDEALSKGAQMVYAELLDVLRKAGLQEVPGAGEPFDPTWHEAMLQVEPDEPVDEPVVAEVLRPGYRFKDRVLRPASVSVAQ